MCNPRGTQFSRRCVRSIRILHSDLLRRVDLSRDRSSNPSLTLNQFLSLGLDRSRCKQGRLSNLGRRNSLGPNQRLHSRDRRPPHLPMQRRHTHSLNLMRDRHPIRRATLTRTTDRTDSLAGDFRLEAEG